jgi:hypothetical protein
MSLDEFMKTLFLEQERDTVTFELFNDNALGHNVTRSKNRTNCCRGERSSGLDYTNHFRRQRSLFTFYTVRATRRTPSSRCWWENLVREKPPGVRSPAHPQREAKQRYGTSSIWQISQYSWRIFLCKSSLHFITDHRRKHIIEIRISYPPKVGLFAIILLGVSWMSSCLDTLTDSTVENLNL